MREVIITCDRCGKEGRYPSQLCEEHAREAGLRDEWALVYPAVTFAAVVTTFDGSGSRLVGEPPTAPWPRTAPGPAEVCTNCLVAEEREAFSQAMARREDDIPY